MQLEYEIIDEGIKVTNKEEKQLRLCFILVHLTMQKIFKIFFHSFSTFKSNIPECCILTDFELTL